MSFVKGFFIFCMGLALGLAVFSGKSKTSNQHMTSKLENHLDKELSKSARLTHHAQKSENQKAFAPALHEAKNKPHTQSKPQYYNPNGIYADADTLRDQTPTAPPTSYKTATNVPTISENEENPEEEEAKLVPTERLSDDRAQKLEEELQAKMDELKELKNSGSTKPDTASFSSFGLYQPFPPEEKDETSGNTVTYGGSFNNGGNDGDVNGSDVLPKIFTVAGVNTANSLFSKNSISIQEYVDYMSMGFASQSESMQRLAITNLSNKLHTDAFATLAQYSSSASDGMNQFLDSELTKRLKNAGGLKFLSQQIVNTESIISSQLAVHTVGLILESDVPSNLFDVLVNDVLHSLNQLSPGHPSYSRSRQLTALIPEIVNS
ncbi:MAG: hypothetical protein M9899_08200 [Bdellovibrionaceae bacterium]|nr:hypothetical protein [Pseudobdellovibrionaceae bacterium]